MSEDKNNQENKAASGDGKDSKVNDPKAMMLAALAKKQKGSNVGKSAGPTSGSKVGSGQTGGAAPKMHRRKAGSA